MVLVNPKDPPQKCRGFFFKNNSLFIWLLKNCLYLCETINQLNTKIKHYESRKNYSKSTKVWQFNCNPVYPKQKNN